MTIGLGAYGRVFKAKPGTQPERLGYGTSAPGGPVTAEPGYWAYFELCNWNTQIHPAIQSAYAISGDHWAGLETVESSRPKLEYVIDNGLAGTMWWALDLDDWNGNSCGKGKYPLIGGVKKLMAEIENERAQTTPAPTTQPGPTTPPVLGDKCRNPDVEFDNAKFEGLKGTSVV